MLKNLEAQKAKAQEKMNRMLNEYYEEFSKLSNDSKFTIDDIEELMSEQQTKVREILQESNSELTSSINIELKKCPKCGGIIRLTKRNEPVRNVRRIRGFQSDYMKFKHQNFHSAYESVLALINNQVHCIDGQHHVMQDSNV